MKQLAIYGIKFYQNYISPLTLPSCRFIPTCSDYSLEAFEKYGFFKGMGLTFWRLMRCHPLCAGGYDPVR